MQNSPEVNFFNDLFDLNKEICRISSILKTDNQKSKIKK